MENQENVTKTKSETTKINGVSAQINLSPGSETHRRFAQLMKESGAETARSFVDRMMDAYENPPQDTDSAATIANLKDQLAKQQADAQAEIFKLDDRISDLKLKNEAEIEDLKMKLAAARNEANENAAKALKIETENNGAIVLKPNPVSMFFLNEMAEKQQTTPGKILEKLFIDDLQNPRANNLPYTVSASRIREVMDELKKEAVNE